MRFAWDASKNVANQRKHGVSFEESSTLFTGGDEYLEIFDDVHSDDEDRFIAIGAIVRGIVFVAYTERDHDTVWIISARWASKREADLYRSHIGEMAP